MVLVDVNINGIEFKIHERLKQKLDNIKFILKKKWDAVILVTGLERSGKSTLAMTIGWYLSEGNIGINNFCTGANDAMYKLKSLPDHSTLIIDEGSLVFSSKDSLKTEQKDLIKVLNVIGQKSMVLIIVLPSFFDLNKYIAVDRSLFMISTVTDKKFNRGNFNYFGRKTKSRLYKENRANSTRIIRPDWNGSFIDFRPPWYQEYEELIKRKSLMETFEGSKKKSIKVKKVIEKLLEHLPIIIPNITEEEIKAICELFGTV